MTLQAAILHLAGHNDGLRPHLLPLMRVAGPPTKLYPVIEQIVAALGMAPLPSAQVKALAMAMAVTFPEAIDVGTDFWADLVLDKPVAWGETTSTWHGAKNQHANDPRFEDWEGETEIEYPTKWETTNEVLLDMDELLYTQPFLQLAKRYKLPMNRNLRSISAVLVANSRVVVPFFLAGIRNQLDQKDFNMELIEEIVQDHVNYEEIKDKSRIHLKGDYKLGQVQISGRIWKLPFAATAHLEIEDHALLAKEPEPDFELPGEYDDYESSHYASVRHQVIHKAASLPKGSDARRKLLATLRSAAAFDMTTRAKVIRALKSHGIASHKDSSSGRRGCLGLHTQAAFTDVWAALRGLGYQDLGSDADRGEGFLSVKKPVRPGERTEYVNIVVEGDAETDLSFCTSSFSQKGQG